MEPKEKALDLITKFSSPDCAPYTAIEFAKAAIDEIMQTNPTIKGTSEDLITQIVQTKSYYHRVYLELDKLKA